MALLYESGDRSKKRPTLQVLGLKLAIMVFLAFYRFWRPDP